MICRKKVLRHLRCIVIFVVINDKGMHEFRGVPEDGMGAISQIGRDHFPRFDNGNTIVCEKMFLSRDVVSKIIEIRRGLVEIFRFSKSLATEWRTEVPHPRNCH